MKRKEGVLAVTSLRRVTDPTPPKDKPQESLSALADTRFEMETPNGQHIKATRPHNPAA